MKQSKGANAHILNEMSPRTKTIVSARSARPLANDNKRSKLEVISFHLLRMEFRIDVPRYLPSSVNVGIGYFCKVAFTLGQNTPRKMVVF